jgi:hypothetical protein
VGEIKERMMGEQFIRHSVELIRSPAMRVLSRAGHKLLMYAESELAKHAGKDNGRIPITQEGLMDFGLYRNGVAATFREVHALGLGEVKHGRGGNAEYHRPNFIRLTYLPSGANKEIPPTNEWQAVTTVEEAEAIARKARVGKKHFSAPKIGAGPRPKIGTRSRPKIGTRPGYFSAPILGQIPAPILGTHPPKNSKTSINPQPLKQGLVSRQLATGAEEMLQQQPVRRHRGNGSWAGSDELLGQQLDLWPRRLANGSP